MKTTCFVRTEVDLALSLDSTTFLLWLTCFVRSTEVDLALSLDSTTFLLWLSPWSSLNCWWSFLAGGVGVVRASALQPDCCEGWRRCDGCEVPSTLQGAVEVRRKKWWVVFWEDGCRVPEKSGRALWMAWPWDWPLSDTRAVSRQNWRGFYYFLSWGGMDGDRQGPGGLMEQLGEIKQGGSPPPKGSPPHPRREPGATAC